MKGFTTESAKLAGSKSKRGENKVSISTKELIGHILNKEFTAGNIEKALEIIRKDSEYNYLNTLIKLLPYVVSKMADEGAPPTTKIIVKLK